MIFRLATLALLNEPKGSKAVVALSGRVASPPWVGWRENYLQKKFCSSLGFKCRESDAAYFRKQVSESDSEKQ